ncbi:MAG: HD domain-containing protein [Bacteroidales bacterium]|jgi:HD superfamily phosphohydrolase|nr:HD domain-containing protein [Bacteroidales bacterium]
MSGKRKIINDPVYGFIDIPGDFILALIHSSWVQRLRHIRQLGLTNYVYPGAGHTRFQHSLGALHLMGLALDTLKSKGSSITGEEEEAACAAILLHDVGHGPFSHALERAFITGGSHEDMSLMIMRLLDREYSGRLSVAIDMFDGRYPRRFLHELIAGQTDMDRLDYLRRDSFFTGVIEGSVSSDRIIKMLNVVGDRLVIEEKGIYSIEKFLIARRMMYWQVYMHKTVIAAENVLAAVMKRARELANEGREIYTTPWLGWFLKRNITGVDISGKGSYDPREIACNFARLDDSDVLHCIKMWMDHPDRVLSMLSGSLMLRNLPAVELSNEPFDELRVSELGDRAIRLFSVEPALAGYFVFTGEVSNRAYIPDDLQVGILLKNGSIRNVSEVSEMFDHSSLSQKTIKYFLCYPKDLR